MVEIRADKLNIMQMWIQRRGCESATRQFGMVLIVIRFFVLSIIHRGVVWMSSYVYR